MVRASVRGTTGTIQRATVRLARPRQAMVQNSPDSPHHPTSTGAATSDTANDRPIEPPTMAMARVRTSSRVASASQAVTAAEMAPPPWMARPSVIQ
ncbi:Uncharacterised protein [Bordetella pertussis]|nr:Uncharacterised protein [Bordetella pertussis]